MAELYRSNFLQPQNSTGAPLAGAKLYFYAAGTTTDITVYQDAGLSTPHAQPVVADSNGIFPPAWVNTASYKTVLKTSADVVVQTTDNIAMGVSANSPSLITPKIPDTSGDNYYQVDVAELAANRTIALPLLVSNDTFVFANHIQTLLNKSLSDSTTYLVDNGDPTKKARFEVSGVTAGFTRVLTVPDRDDTLAGLIDLLKLNPSLGFGNLGLAATVSGNSLTIALKGADGNDPSATNPVFFAFRSATSSSGAATLRTVTSATSLTIVNGSTMGFSASSPGRIWVVAFDDAGTIRLGAVNVLSGVTIMQLRNGLIASSTAEGGVGSADNAQVIYTGTAVSSKAMLVLGYLDWSSGLVTPGAWATAPTTISVHGPGHPLPGDVLQVQRTDNGAVVTGTSVVPLDDTIPQFSEGTQLMNKSITCSSAANVVSVISQANLSYSTNVQVTMSMFQDTTSDALCTCSQNVEASNHCIVLGLLYFGKVGTVSSTTYRVRAGGASAGTLTFNGSGGSRNFGGIMNSYLEIREIMG